MLLELTRAISNWNSQRHDEELVEDLKLNQRVKLVAQF